MLELPELLQGKRELSRRYLRRDTGSVFVASVVRSRFLNVSDAAAAAHHNVHAVGVGRKVVQGKETDILCVRLYVVQKLAPSLLTDASMIPKEINGIPTDVIESPFAYIGARTRRAAPVAKPGNQPAPALAPGGQPAPAVAAPPACTANRQTRQRPLIAGISVAHFQVTAGTLACFCRSTQSGDNPADLYVLSNNHVFANVNKGIRGDDILQPGPADGGTEANDVFAKLDRFVPLNLAGNAENLVDCALGKVLAGIDVTKAVCSIGAITGTAVATERMTVRKHGRTSGFTEGVVTDISYDATVGMDRGDPPAVAVFTDQMRISNTAGFPAFGLGGDSGSLIVDQATSNAVGLYFAGPDDGSYGVANHIGNVISALEITIV